MMYARWASLFGLCTAIAMAWAGFWWSARYGESKADVQLRLNGLCRLQANITGLDPIQTLEILLRLPDTPSSPSTRAGPDLLWPILPHELIGVDLATAAKLEPEARKLAVAEAWMSRSVAMLRRQPAAGERAWVPGFLVYSEPPPHAGDHSTLEGWLVTLGSVVAGELVDARVWKVYVNKMVHKKNWWNLLWKKEERKSRVERLEKACAVKTRGAA